MESNFHVKYVKKVKSTTYQVRVFKSKLYVSNKTLENKSIAKDHRVQNK